MIAIFNESVSVGKNKVGVIHYKPERLTAEQKANAILLDIDEVDMPKADVIAGKTGILYINPQTKKLWYEYEDRPLTQDELLMEISAKLTELINVAKGT